MLWINTSQRANSQNSQLSLDDLGKDLLQFGLILLDFDAKFVAISKKAYPNCNEYVRSFGVVPQHAAHSGSKGV